LGFYYFLGDGSNFGWRLGGNYGGRGRNAMNVWFWHWVLVMDKKENISLIISSIKSQQGSDISLQSLRKIIEYPLVRNSFST
jgi:hypothetical protein